MVKDITPRNLYNDVGIWQFLKSTPFVFHVFIAVAIMLYLVAVMDPVSTQIGPTLVKLLTVASLFHSY